MKKLTIEEFIQKAKIVHKEKYTYDKTVYINSRSKVTITCPIHGDFEQLANSHLQGQGCPKCCTNNVPITKKQFITDAKKIHGDKYDYSLVPELPGGHNKIPIICPKHGIFYQTTYCHKKGQGCPKCASEKQSERQSYTWEQLQNKFVNIHNNKYDYSKVDYIDMNTPICIICPEHGEFWQKPSVHIRYAGCPKCKTSKGELLIGEILNSLKIPYTAQYKIKINNNNAFIDYMIDFKENRYFIEYNGEQHYTPIEHFGGILKFEKQQKRDQCIRDYCKNKNINLIEIDYRMKKQQIIELLTKTFEI